MIRGASITFIVIIAFLLCGWLHTCDQAKRVETALHSSQQEAKIWRDKHDRSNAEVLTLQLDKVNFIKYHNNIVDSLRKHGIKIKTITKLNTINTHSSDTIYLDKSNKFFDGWRSFELDSGKLIYHNIDSIALITHHKKYGFLNLKTKYVTRAISFNPHTTLTGLTSSEITPKPRRLSVGLYMGYGATISNGDVKLGPQAGFGLQYRLY